MQQHMATLTPPKVAVFDDKSSQELEVEINNLKLP